MRGEDEPSLGEVEWGDAGTEEILPGPRQPRRRWLLWWVALAAAIPVIVVLANRPGGGTRHALPTARPASSAPPSAPPASADLSVTPTSAVSVTEVTHPLLGITASWELFARSTGTGTMLRIEFARGRITRTVLPALASGGAVSFLAAPHAVIIRPRDAVAGYLVPDGQPPRPLTGALSSGGVLLPGPAPDQFWMQYGQDGITAPLVLIGKNGHPIPHPHAAGIPVPRTLTSWPAPDGAGYPLVSGPGGVYDLRPGGRRRITTGVVLAVGPTRWLVAECTKQARCSLIVIDQATGARHALRRFTGDPANISGVLSPDGHTAALLPANTAGGPPLLHLIDLSTGTDRRIAMQPNQTSSAVQDDPLVWSPDSRWLFATDIHGQLHAVNARTGQEQRLGVSLPPIEQLAIR